jgi:colicin import membrane protein
MIDGSDLGMLQKTSLKTLLDGAQNNPEVLGGVLDQIKAALGM